MTALKVGARLRSTVCATEVIVIRAPAAEIALCCGGSKMVPIDQASTQTGEPDPALAGGSQVGKRYTDGGGSLEILCTRTGSGTLTCGDEPLELKTAKPLPSSD